MKGGYPSYLQMVKKGGVPKSGSVDTPGIAVFF
jgi:hypothetical protein